MPVTGIMEKFVAREAGWHLQLVKLTVGATGAVSSVDGKGWASDGTRVGELGGIVRDSEAVYTLTLPGYGGVQNVFLLAPVIEDGSAGDVHIALLSAKTLASSTIQLTFVDLDGTPSADELSDGTVVHIAFLVKNSSVK